MTLIHVIIACSLLQMLAARKYTQLATGRTNTARGIVLDQAIARSRIECGMQCDVTRNCRFISFIDGAYCHMYSMNPTSALLNTANTWHFAGCDDYEDTFYSVSDWAIRDRNKEVFYGKSQEQCKQICLDAEYTCVSHEHHPASGTCNTVVVGILDVPDKDFRFISGWISYLRNCKVM